MILRMEILLFTVLLLFPGFSKKEIRLPFQISDSQFKPLDQLVNKKLQRNLDRQLQQNRGWARLIENKKMAVGLVDLSDPARIKYACINGDEMMYAASLPKLAILLAGVQAIEDSTLVPNDEIWHDLRIMISRSDNPAATRMIERLGFEKINLVLTDPRYQLYDTSHGGGLWVGKKYAKSDERHPDPLKGLSHAATVSKVCRFYYLLALGKLVSRERSVQMLEILADPEIHHKFVHSYDEIAPEAKLYRKSGTWRNWHSDSALIEEPDGHCYIIATLVEDSHGEQICRDLVPVFENIIRR